MQRKLPSTSIEAYKMVHDEMRNEHHRKIVAALRKLKIANYEEISTLTTLEKTQVGRRLCELERMEIVYKPGVKKLTRSGRPAFVYQLRPDAKLPEDNAKLFIQNTITPVVFVQKDLF
jgi:predicted transcriptional regulator